MLLQDAHPRHGHWFWRKTVTRCVTLMGNSNPAGPSTGESPARAMLQLLSTAEVKMNRNLRVQDDQLLRLTKLHQGYNPAARRDSSEAWGETEMVFLQHRTNTAQVGPLPSYGTVLNSITSHFSRNLHSGLTFL